MLKDTFDCIIVGAGCAGCSLARKLAEAGFRTALLDRKVTSQLGYPWEVAIEKSVFGRIALRFPDNRLWEEGPALSRYYVNNINHYIEVDASRDDGFFIQHYKFNHFLLNLARQAGSRLLDNHWVSELLLEDGHAAGIQGNRKTGLGSRQFRYKARIVVDATGIDAVLRRQTPAEFLMKRNIRKQDFAYGWNEVREVSKTQEEQLAEKFGLTPGVLYTRIGKYHAYAVLHLRSNQTVNLIFGAAYKSDGRSARSICREFLDENPYFGKLIYGGGGLIPLRRAIDSMAADGLLCIGDSACQVIPTMGSGVASAMHAADVAVRVICEAFNRQNFSRELLWTYNYKYQTKRGAVLASYDLIRRFLQSISLADMDEVFRAHLVSHENFISTFSSKIIEYNVQQILDNVAKVLGHLSLLPVSLRFVQTLRDSQKAFKLYKKYPEQYDYNRFTQWMNETSQLFSHYSTIK